MSGELDEAIGCVGHDCPACTARAGIGPVVELPIAATTIAQAEESLIRATLAHLDGDRIATAQSLGICLKTLYNKLKRYRAEGRPV